ncbi:DsbA family protein [Chitinophaga silvatica]|uniref:DsbA family protein n=1 Tax=Chitinophaga silvatica TaxID=2282649 RepID=A0A3E1Y8I3_9BACT|nr:ClpXP adapter SpxH family protein [Chitinophaga silvatica]RFS21694.1 DsbA family protein [Chitinophaga silvatica]
MKNEIENSNPLLCDPETGICEMPNGQNKGGATNNHQTKDKLVKIIYFTDPICSSCWGIEPQLRKLKLEFGNNFEIEYRMGGLLPDWSYNSGGISKPSDVAHHWDEVSSYYDMPIDGDIWLEDPLNSSYPPSIAFKAAQLQNKEKAILFLREMRESVFLHKKNIAKWEHITTAAIKVGLDVNKLKADFEGQAKTDFEKDLQLAREYGVRGFPTLFFVDGAGHKELVYGSKPYAAYENAIIKLLPDAVKSNYDKNWKWLFSTYPTLTAKEFSELSGTPRMEADKVLDNQVATGRLEKNTTKNGAIWKLKLVQ